MGDFLTRRSAAVLALAATGVGMSVPSPGAAAPAPPPRSPSICTADAITADTGLTLLPDVVCSAGFAMGLVGSPAPAAMPGASSTTAAPATPCQRPTDCDAVDIFHVTTTGWVYDGRHDRACAEDLGVAFMSPQTAATFAAVCDADVWPEPVAVTPGDDGIPVMYVQIALVALGADVAIDGTFDTAMVDDVRELQSSYGLEPTGIVGPETHALLGTGPMVPGAPGPTTTSTTTSATTTPTTTTSATTTPTSTTVHAPSGMAPGTPRPCTAAAISDDVGQTVAALSDCHGGWTIGLLGTTCPQTPDDPDAECETADVFHVEAGGWVHSGSYYPYCAEALADGAGMSIHTALAWSPVCGDTQVPDRVDITPGARGQAVWQLQIALVALGYPIQVDGEFGPRTEAAVRDVQQRNGLAVDGIARSDTQIAVGM